MHAKTIQRAIEGISKALSDRGVAAASDGETVVTFGRTKQGGFLVTQSVADLQNESFQVSSFELHPDDIQPLVYHLSSSFRDGSVARMVKAPQISELETIITHAGKTASKGAV